MTSELELETEPEAAVTLAEILDQDSLQRVCMSYARMFNTGLVVVDKQGQVLVDIPAQYPLCRRLGAHAATSGACNRFDELIQTDAVHSAEEAVTQACACGMQYEILGIRHQGAVLGRLVFGPYRSEKLKELNQEVRDLAGAVPGHEELLQAATADLLRLEVLPRERALLAVSSLGEVLSVIVQTGYARHLTSQIHIAAIQDAYNELTEKNRRLADSVEKLKELDKLKSNFLATVSHELRTPLTSVIGYSEMLLEGLAGELASEQRDYIQIIMEKGDQLLQIINEVLDISKIETGGVQLSLERLSIPELMQQVGDAMMPQARRKEIALTYQAKPTLPPILADRVKTRQVLLNLVSNAIKFTPRNGRVEMSAEPGHMGMAPGAETPVAPPAVLIRVTDTGIGIPDESRQRIFEAFYQVDNSTTREYGGTGLGLSIVKNFVEAHGGHVWTSAHAGGGTVFAVLMPVNPPHGTGAQHRSVRSQSVG
jgi:two-component system, NarL family, sensor histidine kinase BarA